MRKLTSTLSAGRPSTRTDKARAATLASLSDSGADMKRVNFELSFEQHARLKIYAAKQGKSIKDVLSEYVSTLPD